MLHELHLYVVAVVVVLFVTFQEQWMVWEILCACYDDVILDDALSSNLHNLICQVASKFKIVVGICNLLASGTSCPLPWFVWVVFYHWWRRLPLNCWFVEMLAVVCVLILWVIIWCTPPCMPWCNVLPVPLRWPMTWRFWLCVQCWCWVRRRYCLAEITKLRERVAKKYEAQIAIFCILLAINRFSRISCKVESHRGKSKSHWRKRIAVEESQKAIEESGKPLKKVESWFG
jgi:hypothetical protein